MLGTSAIRIKTVSSVRLAQGARSGQEANAWPTVDDASGGVVGDALSSASSAASGGKSGAKRSAMKEAVVISIDGA